MHKTYSFLFCLLLSILNSLTAQITPAQAVAEMGRGINLGNTLEQPTEGGWNNGPAQEAHFDAYQAAGFSNVRIPVRWDMHTARTAPFQVDSSWMNRVEQVVDWGLARGFYITLNGHHEDWLKTNYSNSSLRARYDSIWVQIAARFQHKSDKLLFEIINEPKGMTRTQVDDLNQRILGIIRQTNPKRLVIFGGNEWANSEQLLAAAIPADSFVIGYYHSYDPWRFAGQAMGTWGTPSDYQELTQKYNSVKNWSLTHNIPVHHSEFGALLSCDFNSRMRIYAYNVEQCIHHGFAFSVWDDGGDFRILNRSQHTWPEIKDVLVHYHEESPDQIFSTYQADPDQPTVVVDWHNRTSGNAPIIIERSVGALSNFTPLDTLPANTSSFTDSAIEVGKTYTYRMYTNRADGTLLHGYPTRVSVPATIQTPFNTSPILIPGELEVEEYDNGGEGLAYHDNEAINIPGGFRLDEGVDIGAWNNGYILEYVASGEWIEYTVLVTQAGTYRVSAEVASEVANGQFSLSSTQTNASTSFIAPRTGSWVNFQTITADKLIDLAAGEQEMRLSIDNNTPFNIDKLTFERVATTNIETSDLANHSYIYPNPAKDFLHIQLNEQMQSPNNQVEIYNTLGTKLESFPLASTSMRLDLRSYPKGLYIVKLRAGRDSIMGQIIIE